MLNIFAIGTHNVNFLNILKKLDFIHIDFYLSLSISNTQN